MKGIKQDGKFLMIFKSMYSQLKSCVKIKNGLIQFLNAILVPGKDASVLL